VKAQTDAAIQPLDSDFEFPHPGEFRPADGHADDRACLEQISPGEVRIDFRSARA